MSDAERSSQVAREVQIQQLTEQLTAAGIPVDQWGVQQGSKRVPDLLKELDQGEAALVTVDTEKGQQLRRETHVGSVTVLYTDEADGKTYRLREAKQVFKDGRPERTRPHIKESLAEKMKPTEDPEEAILRGIEEELGISST